jgi:DNA-binding XRE family transcriptional regulator
MRQTLCSLGSELGAEKITAVSFAEPGFSLPKFSGTVARMKIQATPALAEAIRAAMGVLTHDEVAEAGGPSSPTLTKILLGSGATISTDTARKLEAAFGWPRGRVAALAGGLPDMQAEREARGLSRRDMAEVLGVGPKALAGWEAGQPMPPSVLAKLRALLADVPSKELLAELTRRAANDG